MGLRRLPADEFLEVEGAREVGIEFHSLSKTFNMTGWRIGMAVGNPGTGRRLGAGEVKSGFRDFSSGPGSRHRSAPTGRSDRRAIAAKSIRSGAIFLVDGLRAVGSASVRSRARTFYVLGCPAPRDFPPRILRPSCSTRPGSCSHARQWSSAMPAKVMFGLPFALTRNDCGEVAERIRRVKL